jgi:hypothetical protein
MDIYWLIKERSLVTSLASLQPLDPMELVLRDSYDIDLRIVEASDDQQTYTDSDISGRSIRMTIKKAGALSGDALAYTGSWSQAEGDDYTVYSGTISLAGSALIALVEADTDNANTYRLEFTLEEIGGTHYDSTQATITIVEDVYRTGDQAPEMPLPAGMTEVVVDGDKCIELRNSDGQVLGLFKPL